MKLHSVTVISTACLMMLLINMAGASGFSKKVTKKGDCSKGRAERGDSVMVSFQSVSHSFHDSTWWSIIMEKKIV